MDIVLKQRLTAGAGIVFALVAGWQIANENLLLTGVVSVLFLLFVVGQCTPAPIDVFVAGLVLFGYLVGNRGFAQINVPLVPLLPGEFALGLGATMVIWRATRTKRLPIRRDALNFFTFAWLAIGLVRLRSDFSAHGLVAIRDFATFYYAAFFFLAQHWSEEEVTRRWIDRCLTAGFALAAPVFLLFVQWPDIFVNYLSVFGVPVIYVKSDVVAGFMVAGTFWLLQRYQVSKNHWWLLPVAINLAGIAMGNSRAALIGLFIACGWVVVCRDWRWLRPIAALGAAGFFAMLVVSATNNHPWPQTPVYRFYESIASITDVDGTYTYLSSGLGDKPDNNQFRLIWWRAVFDEVADKDPWLGLGFGYDLADQFTRVYYAEGSEEFSARSPHNFLLTVFGRTGLVGLLSLLGLLAVVAIRTWRAGRSRVVGNACFPIWLGVWGILVTACFGVVLEGPMGAAVFWTLMGLANSTTAAPEVATGSETAGPEAPPLRDISPVDELTLARTAP